MILYAMPHNPQLSELAYKKGRTGFSGTSQVYGRNCQESATESGRFANISGPMLPVCADFRATAEIKVCSIRAGAPYPPRVGPGAKSANFLRQSACFVPHRFASVPINPEHNPNIAIPAAFRARVYPGEVKMKKLTLAVLALGLMAAPSFAGSSCHCITKVRVTDQGERIERQICPRGGREGTSDQGRSVGNQKGGGSGTRSSDRSS